MQILDAMDESTSICESESLQILEQYMKMDEISNNAHNDSFSEPIEGHDPTTIESVDELPSQSELVESLCNDSSMEPAEDGLPPLSDSPDSSAGQTTFIDVNLVPEHEKKETEEAISKLEGELFELRSQLRFLDRRRRDALNNLLGIKGSIRVFCRVRPFLPMDGRKAGAPLSIEQEKVEIQLMGKKKEFVFDGVFPSESSQEDVFAEVKPILRSALDGHNVCVFAFGQTGTGKTFTMEGTPESPGIVPRAIEELFHQASMDKTALYKFSLSMVEVYMGNLKDLLVQKPAKRLIGSTSMARCALSMQTDSNGSVEIEGLTDTAVADSIHANKNYAIGRRARSTCWTNVNESSSRSHCLTRITITREGVNEGSKVVSSKLWMIDLGGSERLLKTRAVGQILDEGRAINLSLSALGDVICALKRKRNHVPYRNSKLTQILKDSLGADSKALMLIHISPREEDISETSCSLNFGTRARGIEFQKELPEELKIQKTNKMAELDQEIKDAEEKCQKLRDRVFEVECSLHDKKQLYCVSSGGAEAQEEEHPQTPDNPKSIDKGSIRTNSSTVPRFMAATVCSRQRHLTDIDSKASKMQRFGRKHLRETDSQMSRSQIFIRADSNFRNHVRSSFPLTSMSMDTSLRDHLGLKKFKITPKATPLEIKATVKSTNQSSVCSNDTGITSRVNSCNRLSQPTRSKLMRASMDDAKLQSVMEYVC